MRTLLLAAGLLLATACSLKKLTVDQTADVLKDASRAFDTETDVDFAAAAIPASLKTTEGFLEASPEQPVLLRMLAEGYMSYAFGFVEDEAERVETADFTRSEELRRRALGLYLRARAFGLRLHELDHPEFAAKLKKGELDAAALAEMGEDDLEGLFWTASPWGAAINVGKSDPMLVAQVEIVRAIVKRCAEIDEKYYWAGPRMTLGALEAGLPAAFGGKPEKARAEFEKAVALTGGKHLMTRVLFAKTVGVQSGDRTLFESVLKEVVAADVDVEPSLALANRLAQKRAARYLSQLDEFFP
jgi:hypothetical protein